MRNRIILPIVLATLLAFNVAAQKKPVFTSTYTSLTGKACKILRGHEGQDDAKLCQGSGRYQVRIYSAATSTYIVAELKGSDESYGFGKVSLAFNESHAKVEWRLADGKPFAAILRLPTYADSGTDDGMPGKVIGQELVVIGLKGHDQLAETIDAKTSNANQKARDLADAGFSRK